VSQDKLCKCGVGEPHLPGELRYHAVSAEILYVAGPMSGHKEFNWPLFREVTAKLRAQGRVVLCPTESITGPAGSYDYQVYLKADLKKLLEANAIVLLPGWTSSKGATLEATIAGVLGYATYEWVNDGIAPWQFSILSLTGLLYKAYRS
jgi:hypothetical protein